MKKLLTALLILSACSGTTGPPTPAYTPNPQVINEDQRVDSQSFDSPLNITTWIARQPRIGIIPITYTCHELEPFFSLSLGSLKQGDVLLCLLDGEVTTELPYTVCLSSYILLFSDDNVILESPSNGYNLTPSIHHALLSKYIAFSIPQDIPHASLDVFVQACSYHYQEGDSLSVEPFSYQQLSVIKYSKTD